MVKIVWTRRSLDDLNDIAEYIAKDSPKYAQITLEKILNQAQIIESNPFVGRIVPETAIKNIREIIYGNYRVIYKIDIKMAQILTVHHSARDLNSKNLLPLK